MCHDAAVFDGESVNMILSLETHHKLNDRNRRGIVVRKLAASSQIRIVEASAAVHSSGQRKGAGHLGRVGAKERKVQPIVLSNLVRTTLQC